MTDDAISHYSERDTEMVAEAEALALRHWAYIGDLLMIHGVPEQQLVQIEFHYVAAFIHGYKHGRMGREGEV
jgi:hypothetical protein